MNTADDEILSDGRGRDALRPQEIPRPGWRDILWRVYQSMTDDHVSIVAAGCAFFGMLALFPAIASLVSIAGLVLDPDAVESQISAVATALPEDAASILTDQAKKVASGGAGLGLAAILGLLLALYSASAGVKTLMEGLNIVYQEKESRGFVKRNLVGLALTLLLIAGVLMAFGTVIVAPAVMANVGLGQTVEAWITYARWPIMAVVVAIGLSVIYRQAPSRARPQWRWVLPGAVAATLVWTLFSILFSLYVGNFGSYNETYGALGGVIILLTWMWLSAFIVLMGAELNAEMEHQTARDSTAGPEKPMGDRGAVKADTLGLRS